MSRCATRPGTGAAVVLAAALALPGCFATTKHVQEVEEGLTHRGAWTDERIEQLDRKLDQIHAENEALRVRMDDLADQIGALGGEVSSRLNELSLEDEKVTEQLRQANLATTSLARRDEEDREAMIAKMNGILEEVLAHNERLEKRLDKLQDSMAMAGQLHVVRPGESLSSIAAQYPGITPKQIQEANDISNASLIQVGQELFIPGR